MIEQRNANRSGQVSKWDPNSKSQTKKSIAFSAWFSWNICGRGREGASRLHQKAHPRTVLNLNTKFQLSRPIGVAGGGYKRGTYTRNKKNRSKKNKFLGLYGGTMRLKSRDLKKTHPWSILSLHMYLNFLAQFRRKIETQRPFLKINPSYLSS